MGAKFWIQLNHVGLQTPNIVYPYPFASSALDVNPPAKNFGLPQILSKSQIIKIIDGLMTIVMAAKFAGFGVIQLHAAYGYLLSQFLGSRSYPRDYECGGPLLGRSEGLLDKITFFYYKVSNEYSILAMLSSADFK